MSEEEEAEEEAEVPRRDPSEKQEPHTVMWGISQKNQACNASHFQKLRFVRFPALGTISGHHLECVQRFLFSLFHSNFLVQSLSNSIFWLKESDFGLDK